MNRRTFLTAIPAAVAAVASLKGAGATQSAAAYHAPASTYISPANAIDIPPAVRQFAAHYGRMVAGERYCPGCHSGVLPFESRQGPNHLAVRFDDYGFPVTIDGEEEPMALECMTGPDGWVIADTFKETGVFPADHFCRTHDEPLVEIRFGDVQVQRKAEAF